MYAFVVVVFWYVIHWSVLQISFCTNAHQEFDGDLLLADKMGGPRKTGVAIDLRGDLYNS